MQHDDKIAGLVAGAGAGASSGLAADDLKKNFKALGETAMPARIAPLPQDMERLMKSIGSYQGLLQTILLELVRDRVRKLGRRTLLMDTPAHRAILAGFGLNTLPGIHVAVDAFERRRFVADLKAGKVTFAQAERFGRLIGVEIDRETYNQIKSSAGV